MDIEQAYRTHKDHLYNYIFRLCNNHQLAQDVVQQAFTKLLADHRLQNVRNVKSYLFTVARNQLYDTWKKKTETLLPDEEIELAEDVDTRNITQEIEQEQLQRAVESCVHRLTDKYRELIVLRYIEEMSINEISTVTKYGESDIKVSLLRARQQLDHGLTKHMYLKIAGRRQQCDEMASMLVPYVNQNIPEDELTTFTKHIDHCQICAEDAEEQKRKRKLFALLPLTAAPLSLDTSFNDALAQTTVIPAAGKAGVTKLAIGASAAAIIAGALLFLPGEEPSQAGKPVESPVSTTKPSIQEKKVIQQASDSYGKTGRLLVSSPLKSEFSASQLSYLIYKSHQDMAENKLYKVKSFKPPASQFELPAGDYVLKAKFTGFGEIESVHEVRIENGSISHLEVPIEIGMFKPIAQLSRKNLPHINNIKWEIISYQPDAPRRIMNIQNNQSIPMPPGEYIFSTSLGNIKRKNRVNIHKDRVTDHKVILRGGIVKVALWKDNQQKRRNKSERLRPKIYDADIDETKLGKQYIPSITSIRNDLADDSAILGVGVYTLVIQHDQTHKIIHKTKFSIKDGDTKTINLRVPE